VSLSKNNKPSSDDWRRQGQERYLINKRLQNRKYVPFRSEWEHDHCEFCGVKFSLSERDERKGYSTYDGYYWICNQCFNDFCDEYHWTIS
jgi:hypothetical protein